MNNDNYNLINVSNPLNVRDLNPEITGSLRPQNKLEEEVISWEEELIMNLNSLNKEGLNHALNFGMNYRKYQYPISNRKRSW